MASEAWNIGDGPAKTSADATAKTLEGISTAFGAFKLQEQGNIDGRKEQLRLAADKVQEAAKDMTIALEELKKTEFFDNTVLYGSLPPLDIQAIDALLVQRPETIVDLYDAGIIATEDLGKSYRKYADRDDKGVFLDFVDTTFKYLRAGAAASKLLTGEPVK